MMSKHGRKKTQSESTASSAVIRAKPILRQADRSDQERRALAVSSSALLMHFAQELFCEKTHQPPSETPNGVGGVSEASWNRLVTLCCPSDSGRVALGLTTDGIACSCSPRWPTPMAASWGSEGHQNMLRRLGVTENIIGGHAPMNPQLYEHLQGFPEGWSEIEVSETQLQFRWLSGSDAES